MIPQRLPSDATLQVVVEKNGVDKTLSLSLNNFLWEQGKKLIYNISTKSIVYTYSLEAKSTGTANYDGTENITYNIKSTKTNGLGNASFVPWTMEFSTDNGNTWTTTKPDFITLTTQSNSGSISGNNYNATFAPQTKTIVGNSHDILKARTVLNDVDLSHRDVHGNLHHNGKTTANCYVIHNPGTYKFPAIYGNAMKNGATNEKAYKSSKQGQSHILSPFLGAHGPITKPQIDNINNACLIWQDTQNLISNISYTADGYVHFSVNKATIHNGNAIIAVRDASNIILWSWHIWVTEEDLTPVEITNLQGVNYNILPVNLGWCEINGAELYKKREVMVKVKQSSSGGEGKEKQIVFNLLQCNHRLTKEGGDGPYYQWGRKDPMLPSKGLTSTDKECFTTEDQYKFKYGSEGLNTTDIKEYIRNPHKFNIKLEMDGKYYNLWSTDNARTDANDEVVIKSVYDPSPVGYSLPASNVFTGFTTTGGNTSNPAEFNVNGGFDKGWHFYCKPNKQGSIVFFPSTGYRYYDAGSLLRVMSYGFCWVAGPYNRSLGRSLWFYSGYVYPVDYTRRSYGFTVRPAKEK